MQSILGTPPLVASLALFPAILCSRIVPPVAGRVYDRRGPDVLLPPSCLSPVLPPYATAAENYSSLHGVTFLGMHSDSGDEGGREAGR